MPTLLVTRAGLIKTIDFEPTSLTVLGRVSVTRAGFVEYDNTRGGWTVSFPDGSALPGIFTTRAHALVAEVETVRTRLCGR